MTVCTWSCVFFSFLCLFCSSLFLFFFFFNHTATTEIYTLSLHDALPISPDRPAPSLERLMISCRRWFPPSARDRSEEHTSELQSLRHLVCRLLLEKKKKKKKTTQTLIKDNDKSNVRRPEYGYIHAVSKPP